MEKKILIYTENYLYGGGNRYLIDIVNSISESFEVVILSNPNGLFSFDLNRIKRSYTYKNIGLATLPLFYKKTEKYPPLIRRLIFNFLRIGNFFVLSLLKYYNTSILNIKIKKINPSLIVSCNGGFPGGVTCLDMVYVAHKNKIPVILSVVSVPQNTGKLFKYLYRNLRKYCSKIIVNTSVIKDAFIEKYNFEENSVTILHNTIDPQDLNYKKGEFRDYLSSRFNICNKKIIGFVGRVEELKGIYILLKAFEEICKINPDVVLIVVGSGEIDKAKKIVTSVGLTEKVYFTDFYSGNIYDVLDTFDIFAFPSLWEGLPYAILEAMFLNKVIVSTNVGGIAEFIDHEINGILVEPNDINALARELIKILEDYESFTYLGINARKKAEANLLIDKFASKIKQVLLQS